MIWGKSEQYVPYIRQRNDKNLESATTYQTNSFCRTAMGALKHIIQVQLGVILLHA